MSKKKSELPELPDPLLAAETVDKVYNQLQLKTFTARKMLVLALRLVLLFDRKQQDYGPGNIADFGTYGVVVRMNDKFRRIAHLYKVRRRRPANESILDSFIDIADYALIAYLLETGEWPKTEVDE